MTWAKASALLALYCRETALIDFTQTYLVVG